VLLCPVRACGRPLNQVEKRVVCANGHSFDFSRHGYLNLLQPQDKRSKLPGDSREVVAARRRLHDRGVSQAHMEAIAGLLNLHAGDALLDVGCGDGFYLGSLSGQSGCLACGIDISASAVEAAARRYPACQWIVANADRAIPYAACSFSIVLSITGRMHPSEFQRVLHPGGRLLVAVAAADDLIELRGRGRDRVERTIADFADRFRHLATQRITSRADLPASAVEDVLVSIYRPKSATPLVATRLTFSLDLLLFEAASHARPARSAIVPRN